MVLKYVNQWATSLSSFQLHLATFSKLVPQIHVDGRKIQYNISLPAGIGFRHSVNHLCSRLAKVVQAFKLTRGIHFRSLIYFSLVFLRSFP